MKPTDRIEPRPWRAAPGDERTVEAEIGRATRLLSKPALPDAVRLAHIRAEIRARRGPLAQGGAASHVFYRRVSPWVLAACCILFGSVATAIAGIAYIRYQRAAASKSTPQPVGLGGGGVAAPVRVGHAPSGNEATGAVATGPVAPAETTAAPPVPAAAQTATRPVTRVKPAAARAAEQPESEPVSAETQPPPVAATAPGDGGARGEAAQLAEALRALRADGDARRALALLDDHGSRFPAGVLQREAALARVEALAALGRRSDALKALDGMKVDSGESDRGVALLRAELRAAAQRCEEAVGDFSIAISGAGSDEIAERALYGRGVCRMNGRDLLGARADLERYQREFPKGRHKADVARALERLAR